MHQQMFFASLSSASGHIIEGSALFDGSTGYLTRTPAASGNRKKWTFETIVKMWGDSGSHVLFSAGADANNRTFFVLDGSKLHFKCDVGGSTKTALTSTQVFRDFSGYLHIVLVYDSTPSTPGSGDVQMWVNGSQITDLATETYPSQNDETDINENIEQTIGRRGYSTSLYAQEYIARASFYDGQKLTPTSFGETTDDGFWQINDVSELTFGTNGFLIEGGTNVAAGVDSSYTEPTSYVPVPVTFDGTNDSLTRGADLTGLSDVNTITIAGWFKLNSLGTTQEIVCFGQDKTTVYIHDSADDLRFFSRNADNSVEQAFSSGTVFKIGIWYHFALSSNGTTQQLYINGVSDLVAGTNNSDTLNLTPGDVGIGCRKPDSGDPDQLFDGDLADIMMDDTRIDLSNSTNLAKFISATGEPVDPSSNGSTPFGASPLIYLNSNALATWHTNSGTGGGFTENGALTAGSAVRGTGANDFSKSGTITATNDSPTNGSA